MKESATGCRLHEGTTFGSLFRPEKLHQMSQMAGRHEHRRDFGCSYKAGEEPLQTEIIVPVRSMYACGPGNSKEPV